MKEPKLSRESARAFVARFAANVKERMESQEVSMTALGRVLSPESKSPASRVYFMLRAAKLPSDEVMQQVAKALNCTVEALHHGELEQYKGSGRSQKAEVRRQKAEVETEPERRGLGSTHFRGDRKPARPAGFVQPVALVTVPQPDDAILYGFVFDALRERAGKLSTEPTRLHAFVVDLGRVCRKYEE